MNLTDSVKRLPYVGDKYAILLNVLGIETVRDLLYYFPRTYTDSSQIYKFSELSSEEKRATIGKLQKITNLRTKKRITIQKGIFLSNEGSKLTATWFNQPFIINTLKEGETYLLFGKKNPKAFTAEMTSPDIEILSLETKHIGRITPVYDLTAGVKNKWLRTRIKWLIDKLDYIADFQETLPAEIIKKFDLPDLKSSLYQVHFPESQEQLDKARFRLGFDELLAIQIKIEKQRIKKSQKVAKHIDFEISELNKVVEKLSFKLTEDQTKVVKQLVNDLSENRPMDRLLQGDVGSGKTIVAALGAYAAHASGFKVAYIAPTTILSEQIYQSFKKVLPTKNIILVNSRNKKEIPNIKKDSIIIGTHALLFLEKEQLDNLNFLIIDEEHRFGVKQREALLKLEEFFTPHKLSMTATPIPRSLAMAIWGDSDISYIKSKPKDRKEIKTFFTPHSKMGESYDWIKKQMSETHTQVFWVCPLIEESEILDAKSAEETFKKVEKEFSQYKVRLVHGKTKDKEEQIEEFKSNKFDILVTTPIIEVGIDIPNANIITIESAERFGLAQLHQFRGRVGRGADQGYCLLYSTNTELSEDQKARLKYFCQTTDGLKLAEFDLKRRGPGEVYGTRQSGIPELRIANIFDEDLLEKTKIAAKMILSN